MAVPRLVIIEDEVIRGLAFVLYAARQHPEVPIAWYRIDNAEQPGTTIDELTGSPDAIDALRKEGNIFLFRRPGEASELLNAISDDAAILYDLQLGGTERLDITHCLSKVVETATRKGKAVCVLCYSGRSDQTSAAARLIDTTGVRARETPQFDPATDPWSVAGWLVPEAITFWQDVVKLKSLRARLWPEACSEWFSRGSSCEVPHNFTDIPLDRRGQVLQVVRHYIESLDICVPDDWFGDEQIPHLYADLKYVVGKCARAHSGNGYSLTLGNALILLASAIGKECAKQWLGGIRWAASVANKQILPAQSKDQAQAAILSLVDQGGLFSSLARHKVKRTCLVEMVSLTGRMLSIRLDFSCRTSTEDDKPPLLEKVVSMQEQAGDLYGSYREFSRKSAVTDQGWEPRCVINVKADQSGSKTILEIVRCGD